MMVAGSRKHIVIVTDAWDPQTNGVVITYKNIVKKFREHGYQVDLITPEQFDTTPAPGYSQIPLAIPFRPKKKGDKVSEQLLRLKPDYIHIGTSEGPLGLVAEEFCRRKHLNFTSSYHTKMGDYAFKYTRRFGIGEPSRMLVDTFMRRQHTLSRHVLAPTASVCAELVGQGYDPDSMVQWTRGVDHTIFHPGQTHIYEGQNIKGPVFLYVGRVSYEKDIDEFLDIPLPGTKVVIGEGPALDELKGKHLDVVFTGLVKDRRTLAEYYRGADVFVFPSKTDTLGNVMLEALASGVPVAAYNVTGPMDIVTSDKVGALAPCCKGDDEAIRQTNLKALKEACMKAYALKQNGCTLACGEFAGPLSSYTWENAFRIMEASLVQVGAPNRKFGRLQEKDKWGPLAARLQKPETARLKLYGDGQGAGR